MCVCVFFCTRLSTYLHPIHVAGGMFYIDFGSFRVKCNRKTFHSKLHGVDEALLCRVGWFVIWTHGCSSTVPLGMYTVEAQLPYIITPLPLPV